MNFKQWLLLTENIADLESIPPENLLDFIKNNISDGKSKSEKLIQFAKTANVKDLYDGLIRGFDNGISYQDLTKVPYDEKAQQILDSEVEKIIKPYIEKNYGNIFDIDSHDGVFYYLVRKKPVKKDSSVKLYANFMPSDKNAPKAIMKLTDYYANNLQFFRQAKFSQQVNRRESFILYLSKEGENQIEKINKDISSILTECGINHNDKPTSQGEDNPISSGNDRKSVWFSFLAIAPILGKDKIQELVNWIQTKIQDPNVINIQKTNRFLPLISEMSKIKTVADFFKKIGIVISGNPKEKNDSSDSNSVSSGNELNIVSSENNKKQKITNSIEIGNKPDGILSSLLPNAVRFYSSSQFKLLKEPTGWYILQTLGAKNQTNLNNIPIKKNKLNNGDVISVGKTQQGKLTVQI